MTQIERKLASVRRVSKIEPIKDADAIEVCTVDGWKVVAQKGLYKENALVVYFEIDSFLPIHPAFEFLRKSSYRNVENFGEGFRIKTIKLRGQVSQGLLMPFEELSLFGENPSFDEGDDCTQWIGVRKWDPPVNSVSLGADQAGVFPGFIPKTDEERIQNCFGSYRNLYGDHYFEKTLKLDGTSMTVFYDGENVRVCSRNFELKDGDNTYWQTVKALDLPNKLISNGLAVAIQGELMGPGIQKNREKLTKHEFYVFNVYVINKHEYMLPAERREFVKSLGLLHVPVLSLAEPFYDSVEKYLEESDIISINHTIAEGVVYKSIIDSSVSFKCINNKYLLKCED